MPLLKAADLVKESSVASGNGSSFQLDGAVDGFQTFIAGGLQDENVAYVIAHQDVAGTPEWESGWGNVNASSVLTRAVVFDNSNGDTNRVTFSAGLKHVYMARTAVYESGFPAARFWGDFAPVVDDSSLLALGPWVDVGPRGIAIGPLAIARGSGQFAISMLDNEYMQDSQPAAARGRAQMTVRHVMRRTTDGNPHELSSEPVFGVAGYDFGTLDVGTVVFAKAFLTRSLEVPAGSNVACCEMRALFRTTGPAVFIQHQDNEPISGATAPTCQFLINGNIEVTGSAGVNYAWGATIFYFESNVHRIDGA